MPSRPLPIAPAAQLALQDSDRLRVFIDPNAIAYNLAQLRRHVGQPQPRFWATAKADAYGHGLLHALEGLHAADGISVQSLTEAHICRNAGWHGPILVHAGLLSAAETSLLSLSDLHLVIGDAGQIEWLARANLAQAPTIWLRYIGDTRFGGFDDRHYVQAYARLQTLLRQGRVTGVAHFNHYGRAEEIGGIVDAHARFSAVIKGLPGLTSNCNSAALLLHPEHAATTHWVRPGLSLYGASPLPHATGLELGLKPAMSLIARLTSTVRLAAGTSLGYNGAFVAPTAMRVGLVACGYADGYPRSAQTGTPVMVSDRRTRVLGRPSMDTVAIDLTDLDHVCAGMPVVMWGDGLAVELVARSANTIAAALFTGLTARVPVSVAH
ncbi:MAG: alanine racemase [Burkholderiaceae bacterium]|nr:alanine racemase [Burkholderiaceae bacterium]